MTQPLKTIRTWLQNEFRLADLSKSLPGAFLSYFLTLIFAVSFAALIFRGPLAPSLSFGIGMTLYTAFAVGLVVTFTSSLPGAVAIPSDRTAPILAVMATSVLALVPAGSPPEAGLHTVTAALLLTTALTGLSLALCGFYKLGRLVRFIPYPVIGGFMAGAGWLLVKGAFTVLCGFELNWMTWWIFFDPTVIPKWLYAGLGAVALVYAMRRWPHHLTVPGFVVGSVILFYTIVAITKIPLEEFRIDGWLAGPFPDSLHWSFLDSGMVAQAQWKIVFQSWETITSVLLVSAISVLMITSSLELSYGNDIEGDQELKSAGLANMVSFLGGGIVGLHSLSISSLVIKLGNPSRWVGLLTAIGAGLTLLVGPTLVNYMPVTVLGGLLLFLGLNFLTEWLVDSFKRIPTSDYIIIMVILIVIGVAGYITGVAIGLITALGLFVLRYSRVEVVRRVLTGGEHKSHVDRPEAAELLLREKKDCIHVLTLQGFLFFGTAHSLLEVVKQRLHSKEGESLSYLVVDFRHVTGIDSSALACFVKLKQMALRHRFIVLLSDMDETMYAALYKNPDLKRLSGTIFVTQPDLDHSVEWCENQILSDNLSQLPAVTSLQKLLSSTFKDKPFVADQIHSFFTIRRVSKGEVVAEQHADSDRLYFIESGQISARLKTATGEILRLRTMGSGSVVGETGLYLNVPRTASLIADENCLIHELSWKALKDLEQKYPEAACAFHEFLARTLADRLLQTNKMLESAMR